MLLWETLLPVNFLESEEITILIFFLIGFVCRDDLHADGGVFDHGGGLNRQGSCGLL